MRDEGKADDAAGVGDEADVDDKGARILKRLLRMLELKKANDVLRMEAEFAQKVSRWVCEKSGVKCKAVMEWAEVS